MCVLANVIENEREKNVYIIIVMRKLHIYDCIFVSG